LSEVSESWTARGKAGERRKAVDFLAGLDLIHLHLQLSDALELDLEFPAMAARLLFESIEAPTQTKQKEIEPLGRRPFAHGYALTGRPQGKKQAGGARSALTSAAVAEPRAGAGRPP
jgi:hypothetical protein